MTTTLADIFLVNGTTLDEAKGTSTEPSSHLFHNNHDGTLSDLTHEAAREFTGWEQGVCAGDYDNDGRDHLFVTYYGKNRLYHNEGNGSFKEVAVSAGVAGDGLAWETGVFRVEAAIVLSLSWRAGAELRTVRETIYAVRGSTRVIS